MNVALRLFAGAIDFLQFIFFVALLAFQFITPVGGGVTGALTGAAVCWSLSGGIMEGIANAAACAAGGGILGAGLSTIAIPAGIAIDIAFSCTFGVLLIFSLWVTGRFSLMALVMGFSAEMLPGVNAFLPGWSLLVHRSIQQYKKKQKQGTQSARITENLLMGAANIVPLSGGGTAAALARRAPATSRASASPEPARASSRTPLQTRNFDGIRPANDNRPHSYAQAA